MANNESGASGDADQTPIKDGQLDSDEDLLGPSIEGGMSLEERLQADKNTTRQRRIKLQGMASQFGLDEDEVKMLAVAGLMMPDPFEAMLISDPGRRVEAVQSYAGTRVQYTNLMLRPRDIEAYLAGDQKPVKIDSQLYFKLEKSMTELMIAVRGSAKILDGLGSRYAEQYAFHQELLRLVVERQQVQRAVRNSPPKYLVDFARLMESLGCDRNHLRSVDGKLVRLLRECLGLEDDNSGSDYAEARRFRAWLAEEDSLATSDAASEDEFDRLSRIAAQHLMAGDLIAARSAFDDLESYEASLESEFGSAGSVQADDGDNGSDNDQDDDRKVVAAIPVGGIVETGDSSTAAPNKGADVGPEGDDAAGDLAGRALTADGDGGVPAADDRVQDLISADDQNSSGATAIPTARPGVPSPKAIPIPPEPAPEQTTQSAPKLALDPAAVTAPSLKSNRPSSYLTGWAVTAPKDVEHGRVTGIGRLPGRDAFGGVVSTAALTPDVVPMWARADRQASTGDRLTLGDWYRFEVPFGPYALVHMPKKLTEYVPVRDEMFPPYLDLERYGAVAGFSQPDMRALKLAEMGRGTMGTAIRAVRSVLIMNYGKDDEDLLRFWMFLLVGRRFMDRIDVLFPHGYFHGVRAPDPAALETGSGSFQLVREREDGDLKAQMRTPEFAKL